MITIMRTMPNCIRPSIGFLSIGNQKGLSCCFYARPATLFIRSPPFDHRIWLPLCVFDWYVSTVLCEQS